MLKRKSILAIVVCIIMALGVMTGCGGSSAPASDSASADTEAAAYVPDDSSVLNTGVLRVGMECGYAPYNWTQNDDSNGAVPIADTSDYAYGYDVMMAIKLADALGYELEIYKIDWDSLPVALQSGKIDCVIAGQSITSERLETVDFTEPYYFASIVGLTTDSTDYASAKSVADLSGCTATSQLNTIWYDMIDQIADVNKKEAMETVPNMLVALESGAVNFICTDQPTAMAACVAYDDMVMLDLPDGGFEASDEDINIGISVAKGNSELVEKLNSVLSEMTPDDFVAMMNDAVAKQPLSE